jgi:hypothetical protein
LTPEYNRQLSIIECSRKIGHEIYLLNSFIQCFVFFIIDSSEKKGTT